MELRPGKVLVTAEQIARRVEELGREINAAYGGQPLMIVGVLDGCLIFLGDLMRRLEMPLEIALVRVGTYCDSTCPDKEPVVPLADIAAVAGRNVLVVDDIYDTGKTLFALVEAIRAAGARSVRTCVFLEKERRHEREVALDFVGLAVPDEFVVGYGLDYAGKYRNLPHVAVLEGRDEPRVTA